jgi:hypothetical protein
LGEDAIYYSEQVFFLGVDSLSFALALFPFPPFPSSLPFYHTTYYNTTVVSPALKMAKAPSKVVKNPKKVTKGNGKIPKV